MSGASQPLDTRELRERLEAILGPRARFEEVEQARDAAVRARLPGLARLLGVLEARAGRPWPAELLPVVDRLRRLAAHPAVRAGMMETLRAADHGLAVLAAEAEALQWAPAADDAQAEEVATLSAADALGEERLADDDAVARARQARLGASVAASVRAALDWLTEVHDPAPLSFSVTDGVLDVTLGRIREAGLRAATEVIAAVNGNLRPAGDDAWTMRVPTFGKRACYLMVLQDQAPLALPWHAVLRVRMVEAARIEPMWHDPVPLVDAPPHAAGAGAGGLPLVHIAHGRKQAWLVCDRIVWRMMAEREPAPAVPPLPGLTRQVRTEEGERWWLAEPAWLLQAVAAPPLPGEPEVALPAPDVHADAAGSAPRAPAVLEPPPAPAADSEELPARDDAHVAPLHEAPPVPLTTAFVPPADDDPLDAPFGSPPAGRIGDEVDRALDATFGPSQIEELSARGGGPYEEESEPPRIEPVVEFTPELPSLAGARDVAPARHEPPGDERRREPRPDAAPAPVPAAPRALVAEDSITARVFLVRMLEQRGFEVDAIGTAAELDDALAVAEHELVCVDVELPDRGGDELLGRLNADLAGRDLVLVALVRDADDDDAARRAGIHRTLRKPFDDRALDELLLRADLMGEGRR